MPSENGLTRREELLVVATKLFAARGYHGTRMDDVADVVGLNKATVYHYYASKSLILYDIYQQAAERTLTAVHDDPSMSAREALYQYTVRLLTGIAGNQKARRCISRNSRTSPNGSARNRSPRSARRKPRSTSTS